MAVALTVQAQSSGFAVHTEGKPMLTPGKHPLIVPTRALAEALAEKDGKPLITLANTAIDRVVGQEALIVTSLLVYADTDTLCYRAPENDPIGQKQRELWDPVLDWARKTYGSVWQTAEGIMPLEQSPALHRAIEKRLQLLDPMHLAAACVLVSGFSSLLLLLAVLDGHLDAETAFRLSRLEEDMQAEHWGRDEEAGRRAERLREEILAAARFLRLLDAA